MNIQFFNSPAFGEVRSTIRNGEIAFVVKDVAERLGYNSFHSNLITHIPDEWRGHNRITTPGEGQEMTR